MTSPNQQSEIVIDPRVHLAEAIGLIYRRGMTTTSGGNLSEKDDNGDIWITPAGVDKGKITPDDITRVAKDGEITGVHKPSSELPFHQAIYAQRPDIRAVIHAHPEALVAFAIAGLTPNLNAMPQARLICGPVGFAPYELPGSKALGEVIANTLAGDWKVNSVILENHGVVVVGRDLDDAFQRFETLELCARALIHAHEIGGVKVLRDDQLDQFEGLRPGLVEPGDDWVPTSEDFELRHEICSIVKRACRQGLMISSYGTVSMRAGEKEFVMTPHGVSRRKLTEHDLVTVREGVVISGGRPSRATKLHQVIYDKYPEIRSVITTQAPSMMGHAVACKAIDVRTNPESWVFVRDIGTVPFGVQLTDEPTVPDCLTPLHPVVLVENDCLITIGGDLMQTFDRMEVAEFTARSNLLAQRLGGAKSMNEKQIGDLRAAFLGGE